MSKNIVVFVSDKVTHEGEPLVLKIDIEGTYNDIDTSHNSNFNDDVLFELEVLEEEVGDKLLEDQHNYYCRYRNFGGRTRK